MKKILIITYDMIPHAFTWGGCQRMYYLTKSLLAEGHDVKVIALRSAKYNTYGKEELKNVVFTEAIPKIREEVTMKEKGALQNVFKRTVKEAAFKLDALLFNEIQAGNGIQAFRRFRIAKSQIVDELKRTKYDVVLVSGPPFVVFNCIPLVKKVSPKSKLFMDYRDPWNLWHEGNYFCEKREQRFQRMADVIVCTNNSLCDDMSLKYGICRKKYYVIANGFIKDSIHESESCRQILPRSKLNIVYTGAILFTEKIDGYRDTTKLLEAFGQIIGEGNSDIVLTFVGAGDPNNDYSNYLRKKFGENIKIIGQVSSTEANSYVEASDICLLLHTATDNSGKYLISGKAYDYIQKKKFILSIAKNNTQHSKILKEYGIGINVENDTNCIKEALLKCYLLWRRNELNQKYASIDVDSFSRKHQVKKYLELILN